MLLESWMTVPDISVSALFFSENKSIHYFSLAGRRKEREVTITVHWNADPKQGCMNYETRRTE